MIITVVRPVRGHQVKLTLTDGVEVCVDKTVWEESPYGVDSSLSDTELEELLAVSARRRAESKAVFLLARRDLSRHELEQKLCREKGRYYAENREAAEAAAARMEELGYVNDAAYARRLAEQFVRVKHYPKRRVIDELIRRGIDRETAREAASETETDETELALAFLAKKRYTVPVTTQELQRVAGALQRYGYSAETVRSALSMWQKEDLSDD